MRNLAAKHKSGVLFPISLQVAHVKLGSLELLRGTIDRVDADVEAMFTIGADGLVEACNHFVRVLFGYQPQDLVGIQDTPRGLVVQYANPWP